MRRLVAAFAAAVAFAGVGLATAPGAQAKSLAISQCTTTSNAILAVNFGHWGGPIVRGCGSLPATGFELLNEGGFATAGTQHDGPAFICRISSTQFHGGSGYPTPADEPCTQTPPATAYWSYWHANPGANSWSYSQLGAMSYHPEAGSVDYWQFGKTNIAGTQGLPSVSPDQLRAHNTTSGGGTSRGGSGGGGSNGGGSGGGGSNGGGSNGGGSDNGPAATHRTARHAGAGKTGGARASAARASGSVTAGASARPGAKSGGSTAASASSSAAAGGADTPRIVDASQAAANSKADASPASQTSAWPVVLGVGLAVVLAGGAGFTVLRRRRAESADY